MSEEANNSEAAPSSDDQQVKLEPVILQGEITPDDFCVITRIQYTMTKTKWYMMAFIALGLMGFGGYFFITNETNGRFIGLFFMAFGVIIPAWFFMQAQNGTTAGFERLGEDVKHINALMRHDGIVLNTPNGSNKIEWKNCNYYDQSGEHIVIFLRKASRFIHLHSRYAKSPGKWQQAMILIQNNVTLRNKS